MQRASRVWRERRKFPEAPAAGRCPTSVVWQELLLTGLVPPEAADSHPGGSSSVVRGQSLALRYRLAVSPAQLLVAHLWSVFFWSDLSQLLFGFCRKEHILAILALRGLGRARRAAIFRQVRHAQESSDRGEGSTLFAEIDVPVIIGCF